MEVKLKNPPNDPTDNGKRWLGCEDSCNCNCRLTYSKGYTPLINTLSPPVVYGGSTLDIYLNAYSEYHLVNHRPGGQGVYPFVKGEVDGVSLDFSTHGPNKHHPRGNYRDLMYRAKVTQQPISRKSKINMLWENGYAVK